MGAKASQRSGDNFYFYGTITYTQFLQNAAVDGWITPGAGFAYRLPDGLTFSAGFTADLGDGYESHQIRATLQLPF